MVALSRGRMFWRQRRYPQPTAAIAPAAIAPADDCRRSASPEPRAESKAARGTRPRETRIPIKGIRKATAEAMVRSIKDSPQATVFVTIDVTATVDLVSQLRQRTGQKINVLAMTAKAVCLVLADYPALNSKWDEANQEIVEFGYVNLGIAVATPRGLMVPNIPDADLLDLSELTAAIANSPRPRARDSPRPSRSAAERSRSPTSGYSGSTRERPS